jgi:DNA-binding GntR family transcriptional regulator
MITTASSSSARRPRPALLGESYLQQWYDVPLGTAKEEVELLRSEALLYTVMQRGTYVTEKSRSRPRLG